MRLILGILLLFSIKAQALTGTEIAQKVYNSNREADSFQKTKMTLIDKSKSKRERVFIVIAKDNNKYDSQSLIAFSAPKSIKRTGLLIHNHKGSDADQWLYLPALKKTRRIASAKKQGRFVGSDLSYEDLEDRPVSKDNHELIGEKVIGGQKYYLIKSTPKDPSDSMYRKIEYFVDPNRWTIKKADFYTEKEKVYKTLLVKDFKKVGKTWIAEHTTIKNLELGHTTVLEVIETKFNNNFNPTYFQKGALENPGILMKYLK
ncbi:MAG: outer membrane lipoprotein-sorting protein [Bdellovibrionales bacterium]